MFYCATAHCRRLHGFSALVIIVLIAFVRLQHSGSLFSDSKDGRTKRKTTYNSINHTLLVGSLSSLELMQPNDGGRTISSSSSSNSVKNKTLNNPSHHIPRFCGLDRLVFSSSATAEEEQASRKSNSSERRRNKSVVEVPIDYQCRGEAYDKFTHRLEHYTNQLISNNGRSSLSNRRQWWGKRDFPFPDNASILAIGNSHTKQTIVTLLCQYKDQVQAVQNLGPRDIPDFAFFFHVTFFNNASLLFAGNHPFMYSRHQWHNLLRNYDPLNRGLYQFDTIFLGQFNSYAKESNRNFQTMTMEFSKRHPDWIDFEHDPAPSLEDVVKLLQSSRSTSNKPSPIILVLPMFAKSQQYWERKTRDTASKLVSLSRRSHNSASRINAIKVLHTRRHIEALGTECGSLVRDEISNCHEDYDNAHRCTGPRGGDADSVAWDLIELLYQEHERRQE